MHIMKTQSPSRRSVPVLRSARKTSAWPSSLQKARMAFNKGWNVAKRIMCLGLAVLVWHTGHLGYAIQMETAEASPGKDLQSDHVVTGTLDQLDFGTGKGLLKTDLGKSIFFEMVQPELFRRLSVGQRVTIGMNEQGHAVKVMEIPPVELPNSPVKK